LDVVFDGWPQIDLSSNKLDHWKWKYLDRPIQNLIAYVSKHGNKTIACLHETSTNLKIQDRIYFSSCGGDLAVHPDYRGRGIWRRMVDDWVEVLQKDPYIIGYSNSSHPVVVGRAKKNKFTTIPGAVRLYIRIHDVDKFLQNTQANLVKKLGYRVVRELSKIRYPDKEIQDENLTLSTISQFDARIDDFWESIKDEYDLIVERNRDYLNWRYCDPRGGNYRVRIIEENDAIVGYSVVRINRYIKENPKGYIIDIVSPRDHENIAVSLFNDACKYFDDENVNEVHYWAPKDHFYSNIIGRFGFLDSQTEVLVWFSDDCDKDLLETIKAIDKKRVMFQLGDVDWI
jgi:ribosomal protein S18 acetylase RimI-like enzyme